MHNDNTGMRILQLARSARRCPEASRNTPKLTVIEILPACCLAHGRRQFTEVAESFPGECRYVLESLGAVYGFDAEAKDCGLTPEERLQFHQTHSAFAGHKTEPNSGLGKASSYLLRRWTMNGAICS